MLIEEITYKAKIEYEDVPDLALSVIRPLIERYKSLFPSWAQLIYVQWNHTGDGSTTVIECRASYEYRQFTITFHPSFLAQSEDAHRTQVIHEIIHASSCLIADWARDTIERLVTEADAPKFRETLLEELRRRHESFVQDLALRLADVLP
jgi:hypothetical protein